MDRFFFNDFPAEKKTKFNRRVKSVSVFDANGNFINLHSASTGNTMKLTVYPVYENGLRKKGYAGYFEQDTDDAIVVIMPGESFTVEY